jgi:adenine-specific DNA-methyltransferase
MDEIFTRDNFLNSITVQAKTVAGASGGGEDKSLKKNTEYILLYSKDKSKLEYYNNTTEIPLFDLIDEKIRNGKSYEYDQVLVDLSPKNKKIGEIESRNGKLSVFETKDFTIKSVKQIAKEEKIDLKEVYAKYLDKIFRTQDSQSSLRIKVKDLTKGLQTSIFNIEYIPDTGKNKNKLTKVYYYKGEQINFLSSTTKVVNKEIIKIRPLGSLWTDIGWDGIASEGGVKLKSGKKPEKLLRRIIDLCTQKNDLVLDYHLGSGTTVAVAHKMERRYIGLEQLDYGENDTVIRLESVINGDETGVSKALNWKGGGSFVYAELIQWNEKYVQRIINSKTSKDLEKIYKDMQKEAFFRYDISLEKFKEEKTQKSFAELSVADQKQVLIDCLDTNHLYVNFNDIEDSVYKVDKKDIELNKKFYK